MDPFIPAVVGTAARQLADLFGAGRCSDLRLLPDAARLIGGAPAAFANWVLIGDGPAPDARARELAAEVTQHGLPGILVVAETAATAVAPVADELELVSVGTAPWMVCRPERTFAARPGFRVERVTTPAQLQVAYGLMADAFAPYDFTVDVWNAVFGERVFEPSIANLFVAYRGDEPYSAVTTAGSGATIGIWNMATPTAKQRQGAGRAALEQAMAWHQERGVTTFLLMASPEGIRLYEQTGYRTIMETPIWLIGESGVAHH